MSRFTIQDAQEAKDFLTNLAETLDLESQSSGVINEPKFFVCSGSSKPHIHHYGTHGLIIHTKEVVDLCMLNYKNTGQDENSFDKQLLFLAALYHDIGKIYDYELVGTQWIATKHKRNIHHISRSVMIFNENVRSLDRQQEDEVIHAILAHHGTKDRGSPVYPNSKIAWLLHLCDSLSARMDDCLTWDHSDRSL